MVAGKGSSTSLSSSAPSTSSSDPSNASSSSNADSSSSSDAGDSDAGMVCSVSPPRLKDGRHPKTRKSKKSIFKQCSSDSSPRTGNVSKADSLAERLGTLMLLGHGKAAVTGRVKRFALEKGRPSLLGRAKRRPPALSWDQVEPSLDVPSFRANPL
ncbi:hypothetical protein T484DRAFT_1744885 [Baffinella frigidus]|nr:hypothetical protein T484DRAFT_1744885 [Cryptophyta sp. CCMP2293]